ncbi:MAG: hypothetical protein WCE30_24105 [Mycobacterium sp.]
MSHRSGRHTHRGANAVPVREFLAGAGTRPSANAAGSLALRRPANVAVALTAATAIAFAPMVATQAPPVHLALREVHVSDIHLSAIISDADIKNLVNAVNSGLNQLDSTVANVAGLPGQTLAGALTAASSLTDNFWSPLVAASQSNPLLANVFSALRTVTSGGLTKLAATTAAANGTVTLSTGQVATLLTSTLSGASGTVLYAISNLVNNPLSLLSYTGLINAPVTIVGGVVSNAAAAVSALGTGAISVVGNVVTGATAQVSNLITAANTLVNGVEQTINQQQVNSLITIAQQIVTAPLNASISLVNGATAAIVDTATTTVQVAATAVQRLDNIWLSIGDGNGVIQNVINTIAAGPLSPGSYVNAAGEVITGAAASAAQIGSTIVGGFLPLPFRVSATMVSATAGALNNLADGLAAGTVAALEGAGVSPFFANAVYGLVGAVKTAMSFTAGTITTALNAVAALAATAVSVTGAYNPAAATPAAATAPTALAARTLAAVPVPAAAKAITPASGKPSATGAATPATATDAAPASAAATVDKTTTADSNAPVANPAATVSAASSTAATATATAPKTATPKSTAADTKDAAGSTTSTTTTGTGGKATATTGTKTATGTSTAAGSTATSTGTAKTTAADQAQAKASTAKTPDVTSSTNTAKSGSAHSPSAKTDSPSGAGHTTGGHTASGPSGGHDK